MTADVALLFEGYVGDATASTVGLIREGDHTIVVDPGMVPDQRVLVEALAGFGLAPDEVTDVVLSHHHPDHTVNAGLFPAARVHDHWAVYRGDRWDARPADGAAIGPSTRLLATPGHTPQDVTTLVTTAVGLVAFTHLWWTADGPAEDPLATDPPALHANRVRVLDLEPVLIVPGHGPGFPPGPGTPL